VGDVTRLLDSHQYGEAGRQLREFIWSEFCDWYIELAKVRLRGSESEREATAATLHYALDRILRLLHPFAPFVTEALWGVLSTGETDLIVSTWPGGGGQDHEAETTIATLIDLVSRVRNARTESNVEPGRWIAATIYAPSQRAALESLSGEISTLARIGADELTFVDAAPTPDTQDAVIAIGEITVVLPLAGLVDLGAEQARIEKELASATGELERIDRQLGNANFVERAPEKVVGDMRNRRIVVVDQVAILERRLSELRAGG